MVFCFISLVVVYDFAGLCSSFLDVYCIACADGDGRGSKLSGDEPSACRLG